MDDIVRNSHSRADELEERLIDFAVRIVRLSSGLPKTPAGKHIAGQILRGAESHADFVHKLRIVLKELNETSIWLRMIERSELIKSDCSPKSSLKTRNFAEYSPPL
jgi:four helix bundle protein